MEAENTYFEEFHIRLNDDTPIKEITIYGSGEMRLELRDTGMRLLSTVPCTMMRGPPYRLVVNNHAQYVMHITEVNKEFYGKIGHINEEVGQCERFPTLVAAQRKLLPLLEKSAHDTKNKCSQEWIVTSETMDIKFLNNRSGGYLEVYNRSFFPRSLRLGFSAVKDPLPLPPYGRRAMGRGPSPYALPYNATDVQKELHAIFPPPPPLPRLRFDDLHQFSGIDWKPRLSDPWTDLELLKRYVEALGRQVEKFSIKPGFLHDVITHKQLAIVEFLLTEEKIKHDDDFWSEPGLVTRIRAIGVNEAILSFLPRYKEESMGLSIIG